LGDFAHPAPQIPEQPPSRLKRVDYFDKTELVEVRIPRANSPDSVLAHQNSRMRVVEEIAGDMRQLGKYLSGYIGMAFGGH
jgi:hypothetical protein